MIPVSRSTCPLNWSRLLRIVAGFSFVLSPGTGIAGQLRLETGHRFFAESVSPELQALRANRSDTSTTTQDHASYQAYLSAELRVRPIERLGFRCGLDSGLLDISSDGVLGDGRPLTTHARDTLFLGEVSTDLQIGESGVFEILAGRFLENIGRGLIYDAYAFGVVADLDTTLLEDARPWHVRLTGLVPDGTFELESSVNPLTSLEVEFKQELWHASVLGAYYADNGDGLVDILADAALRARTQTIKAAFPRAAERQRFLRIYRALAPSLYDVQTFGDLFWVGLTAGLNTARVDVELSGMLSFGSVSLRSKFVDPGIPNLLRFPPAMLALVKEDLEVELGVQSAVLAVDATAMVTSQLSADAFAFIASGDDADFSKDGRYSSFLGVIPRLTYTTVYFNGGINANLASPGALTLSPDGAGIAAVGLGFTATPIHIVSVRLAVATLTALQTPQDLGAVLGHEVDGSVSLRIARGLHVRLNGGVFVPGGYYGDLPVAWQVFSGFTYTRTARF